MKKITGLILHCLDSKSDKIYIFEIFEKVDFYYLAASWGKRNALNLASQLKGQFPKFSTAENEMNRLAKRKKKKGYVQAAENLDIPGHKNHQNYNVSSGSMTVEIYGDGDLGCDEYGEPLRRFV